MSKDPVSEGGEASDAEADTLEYLDLVVAALGEAVGIWHIEAYVFSVLKCEEVLDQVALFALGKYVCYLSAFRVGQDSLVLFTASAAFELIYGQHLREFLAGVIHELEIPQCGLSRDIVLAADLFCRA